MLRNKDEAFYVNSHKTTPGSDTFSLLLLLLSCPHPPISRSSHFFCLFLIQFDNFFFLFSWYLHIFFAFRLRTHHKRIHVPYRTEGCFAANDDAWREIINLDRHEKAIKHVSDEGKSFLCLTNEICRPFSVSVFSSLDMWDERRRDKRQTLNCLLSRCIKNSARQHSSCRRLGCCCIFPSHPPDNIPGSHFMSNKYLCLYFVGKFMKQ